MLLLNKILLEELGEFLRVDAQKHLLKGALKIVVLRRMAVFTPLTRVVN